MTDLHVIETACYRALLAPMTGDGLLVLPRPGDDLSPPDEGRSLHEVDWATMLGKLARLGWEPVEGEHGEPCLEGRLPCGREVVGLWGREPIVSEPTFAEQSASWAVLRASAGLVG